LLSKEKEEKTKLEDTPECSLLNVWGKTAINDVSGWKKFGKGCNEYRRSQPSMDITL
jgi:hypothetical protein